MPAPKGHKKWGGRSKGGKNVATVLREKMAQTFIQSLEANDINLVDAIAQELEKIKGPVAKAQLLVSMLPYQFPKMKQVEFKIQSAMEGMTAQQKIEMLQNAIKFLEEGGA